MLYYSQKVLSFFSLRMFYFKAEFKDRRFHPEAVCLHLLKCSVSKALVLLISPAPHEETFQEVPLVCGRSLNHIFHRGCFVCRVLTEGHTASIERTSLVVLLSW